MHALDGEPVRLDRLVDGKAPLSWIVRGLADRLVAGGLVPGGLVPGGLVPGGLVAGGLRTRILARGDRPVSDGRAADLGWPRPTGRLGPAEGLTRGGDFAALQSISIDYGVMEPESQTTHRIALVPGDFGWSDVGSFAALPEVRALDARGNAVSGDAIAVDCDGCVVLSEGKRLVAAVGLRDLCIVDAGDALLVVPRERAQDVRAVVDSLKSQGRSDKL